MKIKRTGNGCKLIADDPAEADILRVLSTRNFTASKMFQDVAHTYVAMSKPYLLLENISQVKDHE